MTNEYEKPEMVPLKEYIEAIVRLNESNHAGRIKALEELIDSRQEAIALALEKQESTLAARFESVNEWRATYGDLASRAVSKEVFDGRAAELERRINALEQKQANIDGRILGISGAIGFIMLVINLIIILSGTG